MCLLSTVYLRAQNHHFSVEESSFVYHQNLDVSIIRIVDLNIKLTRRPELIVSAPYNNTSATSSDTTATDCHLNLTCEHITVRL